MLTPREIFARTVLALRPYLPEIVLIGGWVHAVHLADSNNRGTPVYTDDIDFSIPAKLVTGGRPELIDLALEAGFEVDSLSLMDGAPTRLVHPGPGDSVIDLDLITEGPTPRGAAPIEGQPQLLAQTYPGQVILQENAISKTVGGEVDPLLSAGVEIRVPSIGAYVLHKGLSSASRSSPQKQAKDLVYMFEILRHPKLGQEALAEIALLATRYPGEYSRWRARIAAVQRSRPIQRLMAEQLIAASRVEASVDEVEARINAQFARALGSTPPPADANGL